MDYQRQIKEKADIVVELSYKLIDSAPKSDHITIYELKQLGEQIRDTCEARIEYGDKYVGKHIEGLISLYHQRYGFYSSEIKQLLEEMKSIALDWFKSAVSEKEYRLYRLQNQIWIQIEKLQNKNLFEETDSEFLVPLGKILSGKFAEMTALLSTPYHHQSGSPLTQFKKIMSFYTELESILALFHRSRDYSQHLRSRNSGHSLSKEADKAITDTKNLFLKYTLEKLSKYSGHEVLEKNEEFSVGVVVNYFDIKKGAVPIIGIPEEILEDEKKKPWFQTLANSSFAAMGFVSPEEDRHTTFDFPTQIPQNTKMEDYFVIGYAFAFARPEALGGQENLSVCFVIRYSYGSDKEFETRFNTLRMYLNPLLDGMRLIRDLMREQVATEFIQKAMENIRNFYTYVMIHPNEVKSEEGEKNEEKSV